MTAESEIRRRIAESGRITFADFMEIALYWPDGAYYSGHSDPIGNQGDYYTSPMVHPAFGALISLQLWQMWRLLGSPGRFTILEFGCGNGRLGRDILCFSRHLPEGFAAALDYVGVERRRATGEAKDVPQPFPVVPPEAIPKGIVGCVLSNELLDAFPVHQVRLAQGVRREVYVALENGELVEELGPLSTPALAERLERLGICLAEGQTAEVNLGLAAWSESAAAALDSGFVLTVDYGREAGDLYSPQERMRGALTTFYRHVQTDAPFSRVGFQDMTAQVDFTSVIDEGRRAGLSPLGLITQERFLKNLGLDRWRRRLAPLGLPQRQTDANRAGMVDLARAGGLGDFKVLIQGKGGQNVAGDQGLGGATLWGLESSDQAMELVEGLPPPLLTPRHLDLLGGRYPGAPVEFDAYWPSGPAG